MTYAEKLKDPRWQRKRLEIMERDHWQCQACGDSKTTLNVHHKFYTQGHDPWDYDDIVLVTLCQPCHEIETEKRDEYNCMMEAAACFVNLSANEILLLAQTFLLLKHIPRHDVRAILAAFARYIGDVVEKSNAEGNSTDAEPDN